MWMRQVVTLAALRGSRHAFVLHSRVSPTMMSNVAAMATARRFFVHPTLVCAQSAKAMAAAAAAKSSSSTGKALSAAAHGAQTPSDDAAAAVTATTTHDVANAESGIDDTTSTRNATSIVAGPYRRVGNVIIVTCEDHPFKHGWEVNRMLRELRLEFKGQTSIHPDIPQVRKRLWRVRHIVRIDVLDLDEAKECIGVPAHITFRDLNGQIPASFGRGRAVSSPVIRSKVRFMRLRRMRLRDVLHRDELEKRLLEVKRAALMAGSGVGNRARTEDDEVK